MGLYTFKMCCIGHMMGWTDNTYLVVLVCDKVRFLSPVKLGPSISSTCTLNLQNDDDKLLFKTPDIVFFSSGSESAQPASHETKKTMYKLTKSGGSSIIRSYHKIISSILPPTTNSIGSGQIEIKANLAKAGIWSKERVSWNHTLKWWKVRSGKI